MEEPMRRIAENAGRDGGVIIGKVRGEKKSVGYNAATQQIEDLLAAGIIDPAKVVRTALQNAASIAGLLLTTDVAITDLPEKAVAAPPMPGEYGD
jgi:chaperonin GroEL